MAVFDASLCRIYEDADETPIHILAIVGTSNMNENSTQESTYHSGIYQDYYHYGV